MGLFRHPLQPTPQSLAKLATGDVCLPGPQPVDRIGLERVPLQERVSNMNTDSLRISTVEETTGQTPAHALDEVAEQVRRDAVTNSKEYLDETTVPHGGE